MGRSDGAVRARSVRRVRRVRRLLAGGLTAGLLLGAQAAVRADVLSGQEGTSLQRVPQLTPGALGDGALDGLQYADPASMVDTVLAPEANNQGDAALEQPLWIPPGRGGVQPDLTLRYSSSGGSGWVGTGWDLDVGAVEVDTSWGVPRYDATRESETYTLDGDQLAPTAVKTVWDPRVAERDDFSRRADAQWEHVVRHGDNPTNYFWEVTDKLGAKRWYGALPDCGGPDGDEPTLDAGQEPDQSRRDPGAVLTDDRGNIFRWALSAQRDVGGNLVRYFYTVETGVPVGAEAAPIGRSLSLSRIRYTGWAGGQDGCFDPTDPLADRPPSVDFAYEVTLLRDADVSPRPVARRDVVVDARGGFVRVTRDLLRRIEVRWGDYDRSADPVHRPSRTTWTTLVRRYDLNYVEGAFGKTLLASVDQTGSDGVVYATNRFDYFDEVRTGPTTYDGFRPATAWAPGNDGVTDTLLGTVDTSVLGASVSTSAAGRAYIGFNPTQGKKSGSFGGAFVINGGATDGKAEFLDINGDGLNDKVFRDGGEVKFRLNRSGPSGNTTFGPALSVRNLGQLSRELTVGFEFGFEAYLGPLGIQFGLGGSVAIGDAYFTDANDDGLPDFVTNGEVLFNHLEAVGDQQIPTFTRDSSQTKVPIDASVVGALPPSQSILDAEKRQRDNSPLFDSVRRWVAPYAGTVAVTGAVTFDPAPGAAPYASDGVRVAVQRTGSELWSARLQTAGQVATPTGVDAIAVNRGDALYFRVGSVDSGARDQVRWDPTVTYTDLPDTTPLDVDGLDQRVFRASADFTSSGRPGQVVTVPLTGTLRLDAVVRKLGVTSDDLAVEVVRGDGSVTSTRLAWDATGTFDASQTLQVTALEQLRVRVRADSPVDVRQLEGTPSLTYVAAVDDRGAAVPVVDAAGKPTMVLAVPPDVSLYGDTSAVGPSTPWISTLGRPVTARVTIGAAGRHGAGRVTLAVKQRNRLVAKVATDIAAGGALDATDIDLPVSLENGAPYWIQVAVQDLPCVAADPSTCPPPLSTALPVGGVQLRWREGDEQRTLDVPATVHRPGQQGIFPVPYRGWGAAGYRGDGTRGTEPIVEGDFRVDPASFEVREPTGFSDPTYTNAADGKSEAYVAYRLGLTDAGGTVTATVPVWRGSKDNLVVGADFQRSSRRGVDDPSAVTSLSAGGAGARGVVRVGLGVPTFSLAGSVGPVGGGFTAGPSFGLRDYQDMNGDGFPDIVEDNHVVYTGPRGGYVDGGGGGLGTVGQDSSFQVRAGFEGGTGDINISPLGKGPNAQPAGGGNRGRAATGTSGPTGGSAEGSKVTASFGAALEVSATFVNPATSDPAWQPQLDKIPDKLASLSQGIADMNGDGLPDKVRTDPNGVLVRLNLGYRFAATEIRWSSGGFETNQQYAGTVGPTLGFNIGKLEFGGGLSYTEAVDTTEYTWSDVDGDGVADRLRRSSDGIRVAFGTGQGVLPEVVYGRGASPTIDLASASIPTGQQVAQVRNRSLGGGLDFTIGIGPLCIAVCYLIINPGFSIEHSVSSTQVQLTDVDGDGYPDSVLSDADDDLQVFANKRGRSNLLRTVRNAVGAELRLDYRRAGNTVDQPFPHWVMASVEVDDKAPGDGTDTLLTTYEYDGENGSRLEKQVLGFATVTERHRAFQGDGNVADDPVIRSIRRTFRNRTVFEQGLEVREELLDAAGVVQTSVATTWAFQDPRSGNPVDVSAVPGDPGDLHLLAVAASPVRTSVEDAWYANGAVAKTTRRTFVYDSRGNVVRQVDQGEPALAGDDVTSVGQYTACAFRRLDAEGATIVPSFGVGGPRPPGTVDYTWVSVPEVLDVYDAGNNLLRHRDALGYNRANPDVGRPCENQSLTRLDRTIAPGRTAIDEMDYDEWGNYVYTEYPANANGERYRVDYVYDPDSHANIADTVDNHGLRSTATFDPFTGRVASRTDANGQVTTYTYDAFGRPASITLPTEQGTGRATVTYEYHPVAGGRWWAAARHADAFRPDTIDTVTFADGTGRIVQTKVDATVFTGAATAAADVQQVSGAIEYDALGRPVREWYPVTAPKALEASYVTARATAAPTTTDYDVRDREVRVVSPGGRVTATAYGYGGQATFGAVLFTTTVTDPNGTPRRTYTDVRGNQLGVEDFPDSASLRRLTRYGYDGLGQLLTVVDPGGNTTRHTYDLVGNRTSTSTPDGGLVELTYDDAGNLIGKVDPNLRAKGQRTTYRYDVERLVAVDQPVGTPSVTYVWGDATAAGPANGNGAGRIVGIGDGARLQTLRYDALGRTASDTSTMLVHNLNDAVGQRVTYTTSFTQDWLGRLGTVAYPDGEQLTYGYDSGGLLSTIGGTKGVQVFRYLDRLEYDEFFDRRFQQTGNGVRTEYAYDAATRWLSTQRTDNATRTLQAYRLGYDEVGNVLAQDNAATLPAGGLKGGPSTQTFTYDPYYRLTTAKGTYRYPPGNVRDYTYAVTYDAVGNVRTKAQTDVITVPGGSKVTQKPTTYTNTLTYSATKPHQIATVDRVAYGYDANGNFVGWPAGAKGGQSRTATYDAANRMTSVADQGSTTTYTYDHTGTRALERGPAGETAFVNEWWTVRNGTIGWKTVWAGSDRLVEQKAMPDGAPEDWRYFLHKDLQGSTNLVTDPAGEIFQHLEYFPTGEIWVHEKSDVHREPYLYGGAYYDEVRQLLDMGQRWYEPRQEFFYSPDPALVEEPTATVEDANLLPAYTYAESNALVYGDVDGRKPSALQNRLNGFAARALGVAGAFGGRQKPPYVFGSGPISRRLKALTTSQRYRRWAEINEQFEANPLTEWNIVETTDGWKLDSVKLSLWATPQWTVYERDASLAPSPPGPLGPNGRPIRPKTRPAIPNMSGAPVGQTGAVRGNPNQPTTKKPRARLSQVFTHPQPNAQAP